jgi:hypothetical protein
MQPDARREASVDIAEVCAKGLAEVQTRLAGQHRKIEIVRT